MKTSKHALSLALLAALAAAPLSAAELVVVNLDAGTGAGLDDPTPRAPQGGNPGITLGEQRQVTYAYAARMWGAIMQSEVPIIVGARFVPQACTATGAVLGSAGTTSVFRDFPGAVAPETWHNVALTEAIVGFDVNPGQLDISSQFNSRISGDPACLGGADWYYGLDGETPAGMVNFLNVVMHEIGHGIGFQSFLNVSTGSMFGPNAGKPSGYPDVYLSNAFNNALGKAFPVMSNAERAFSVRDAGRTVWTGAAVGSAAPDFLDPRLAIEFIAPAGLGPPREAGRSTLGPFVTAGSFGGEVVVADDATGVGSDACQPLANAAAIAGRIALVDRGLCAFAVKAANAQAAGASGVLVANNVPGLIEPGGVDPSIIIPVLGLSLADGGVIKGASPGVQIATVTDPTRLVGADDAGRVRLNTPAALAPGSTFSHYDTALSPNALMEPSITGTLRGDIDVDLTPALFRDTGWNTNAGNARLGSCDTGVPVVDPAGVAVGASIEARSLVCGAFAKNHGKYVSCMVQYTDTLLGQGLIEAGDKGRITSCAARNK
jgi:hypothetical protein